MEKRCILCKDLYLSKLSFRHYGEGEKYWSRINREGVDAICCIRTSVTKPKISTVPFYEVFAYLVFVSFLSRYLEYLTYLVKQWQPLLLFFDQSLHTTW